VQGAKHHGLRKRTQKARALVFFSRRLSDLPCAAAAMSEIFEGYERQYCEVSANLSRKCASVLSLHGGM
jgi:hypothetical protein